MNLTFNIVQILPILVSKDSGILSCVLVTVGHMEGNMEAPSPCRSRLDPGHTNI